MPTEVIMPQMGESIFEGTLTKWLKKAGEKVIRDEPLFEISTDKVDAEIPSPASGVLTEIKAAEGSTVKIHAVVGLIQEDAEGQAAKPAAASSSQSAPQPVSQSTPAASVQAPPPASVPSSAGSVQGPPASSTPVVMPQMGESIFEGTITKWLKSVGDPIRRDEPLLEISTDKVDAEIPSPENGVLAEIKVPAGSTVEINTVLALIASAGAAPAQSAPSAKQTTEAAAGASEPAAPATASGANGQRVRSSPLVRKMARDHQVDLGKVPATGPGNRVTKEDMLGFLEKGGDKGGDKSGATAPSAAVAKAPAPAASPSAPAVASAGAQPGNQLVPLSRMRSIIAQRMVESKRTSPHVHTVFKIDMSRIVRIREKEKAKYEQRNGVKLTYMPFIARALIVTLRKIPIVNASLEGDSIRYHQHINLGIAVALDWGLIVPVIRQAEERNFLGIARAIADLAERARSKKLKPEEVGSGTITITNPGIFGEQFGTPIINQPESAILGVGGLFKEPTVVTDEAGSDAIAIRSVIRLTLGFDHRVIDGADAGRFMAELKKYLENWNEDIG